MTKQTKTKSKAPAKKKAAQKNDLTLDAVIKKFTKALKSQGNYTEDLEMNILKASGDYIAYRKCVEDLAVQEHVFYETMTREGNIKYEQHPVIALLPTLSRSLENSLKSLGLTLSTLSQVEEDPMETMLAKLEKED